MSRSGSFSRVAIDWSPEMHPDSPRPKLGHDSGPGTRVRNLFARVLTVAAGVAVLIGAVAISIVVFAVLLTVLVGFGLYFWWRTRHVRRQLQEMMNARAANGAANGYTNARSNAGANPGAQGDVIEGEVIGRSESQPRNTDADINSRRPNTNDRLDG
jgi:hypothetical protein